MEESSPCATWTLLAPTMVRGASGRAEVLEDGARGRLVSVGEAAAMADARVEAFEQAVRRRAAAHLGLEALIGVGG